MSMTQRKTKTLAERFWPKVRKTRGCWEWTGAKRTRGYGAIYPGPGRTPHQMGAHRASWEIHHGQIPDGLWVLHACDNPGCVNPAHLFLGDRRANMLDAAAKGRVCTIGKSRQTHCIRGHEFTPENTYTKPNGHRRCRTCAAAIRARSRA